MKKSFFLIALSVVLLLFGVFVWLKMLNLPSAFATVVDISWAKLTTINEKEVEATALGDSLAYGLGDAEDHGYIGDVKYRYEQDSNNALIIKDYGVPNATSTDLIHKLKNEQITESAKSSDLIFINIGTNDFLKSTDRLTKFNEKELDKNQEIYKENLNHILTVLQDRNDPKPIYIMGIYNPKVKWADMTAINKAIRSWNQSTLQVTKSHPNVAFVRTDDLFINKNKKEYFSDKLHPNKKGYALIGKRVYDTLKYNFPNS